MMYVLMVWRLTNMMMMAPQPVAFEGSTSL
jgi:hypothetical protein